MSLPWGNEVNIEIYIETIEILNEINTGKNETEQDELAMREWSGYWNIGQDKWNIKRNKIPGRMKQSNDDEVAVRKWSSKWNIDWD